MQAVPKHLADDAAKDLESLVEPKGLGKQSFVALSTPGRPVTQRFTEAWFTVCVACA